VSAATRVTIPATVIIRCASVMLLMRSTVTRPHTPIAVTAPMTTRARTTRKGEVHETFAMRYYACARCSCERGAEGTGR